MGHAIRDVDAATVGDAVGVLVCIPVGASAGLVFGVMVEAVSCVVVDVMYTACITLST